MLRNPSLAFLYSHPITSDKQKGDVLVNDSLFSFFLHFRCIKTIVIMMLIYRADGIKFFPLLSLHSLTVLCLLYTEIHLHKSTVVYIQRRQP